MNALIVMDLQPSNMQTATHYLVPAIKELIAHHKFDTVASSVLLPYTNAPYNADMEWDGRTNVETSLVKTGTDFVRCTYTMWTPEFEAWVAENDIHTFYLVGCNTDTGILTTAYDLLQHGLNVCIIPRLCASKHGHEYHVASMLLLERNLGKQHIIKNEEVLP